MREDADEVSTAPLCSKVALVDSVEDPLEASPLCSKVALADSVEDPLEASPLCSADSSGVPRAPSPLPPVDSRLMRRKLWLGVPLPQAAIMLRAPEAVIRGAPAPSRDYAESVFLEAGGAGPVGPSSSKLVANQ